VLEWAEVADAVAGPGEVRVRLSAAGVSPIDSKLRSGALQQHFALTFPKIPGRDGTGVVDQVGAGVTNVAIGDIVCVAADPARNGTYAQAVACAAERVVPKPANLSNFQAAALLQPGVSAWIAMCRTAAIEPGMRLLIHGGAGAVGSAMVQLGRHLGAHVTATSRAANIGHILGVGAHRAIAYDRDDFGVLRDLDVVFDLIGGETHARSYAVMKPGGQLVYLSAQAFEDRGAVFGVSVVRAMIADTPEALSAVAALAAGGVLRPSIAGVLPLSGAAAAHRAFEAGTVTRGRLVLDMSLPQQQNT